VSRSGFESLAAHHAGVTATGRLASSNLAACAFESHLPHPMPISSKRAERRILVPEVPGSRPGWAARASVAQLAECPFRTGRKAVRDRPEARCPASPMAGGTSLRRAVVPVRVRRRVPCHVSSYGESAELVPPRQRVRDLHAALGGNGVTGNPAGLLGSEMRARIALP
jgi:hypothetical protein